MSSLPVVLATTLAVGLISVSHATPAAAVTFASFSPVSVASNFRLVNTGSGPADLASNGNGGRFYSTITGSANSPGFAGASFTFNTGPLAALGPISAWFQFDASTTVPASVDGGVATQGGLDGFFAFTSRTPLTIGTKTRPAGTALLRADFTNAALTGALGGTAASLTNDPAGTLTFTSDFLGFAAASDLGFSLSLNSMLSALHVAGAGTPGDPYRAVRSFRGLADGEITGDNSLAISAVPEPETWAMLFAGFALIGLQQRRPRTLRISG